MRLLILTASLWALALAKPEMYKESEDFQYSRSSSDEGSKSGFYGAQRGNMGGNYEKAHNMDSMAQHHLSTLVRQVDGELGEGANTKTGSVFSAGNSRGIYGSGNYDLSNLKGRNFGENNGYDDSQSQSSLHQNAKHQDNSYYSNNAEYGSEQSRSSKQRSGYSSSNLESQYSRSNLDSENKYHGASNYDYGALGGTNTRHYIIDNSQARGAYDQSHTNLHSTYDLSNQNRLTSATPVKIYIRPGGRVALPISAPSYTLYGSNLQDKNSDTTNVLSNSGSEISYKPTNNAKHYESAYSYHKKWEKHDTQPLVVVPTENPFPANNELYENRGLDQTGQRYQSELDSSNTHLSSNSNNGYSAHQNYQSGMSSTNAQSSKTNSAYSSGYSANTKSASAGQGRYQSEAQNNAASSSSNTHSLNTDNLGSSASNLNDLVENINSRPKSYHSSFSYRKAWERRGDPYVITPSSDINGQTSQKLIATSQNQGQFSSQQYGSQYNQKSYSDVNCDDLCYQRKKRSYNINQYEQDLNNGDINLGQQSEDGWDLGQQTENKFENLEDLGQATQNTWDNLENEGQETQNNWDNLYEMGQQAHSKWSNLDQQTENQKSQLENLGQEAQNHLSNNEDLGQQTQEKSSELEDLGQQTQSHLGDLGQETQSEWDALGQQTQSHLGDLGQETQSEWDALGQQTQSHLGDLGQETQSEWDALGQQTQSHLGDLGQETQCEWDALGQQTQSQWGKLEDLGQQTQTNWGKQQEFGQTLTGEQEDKFQTRTVDYDSIPNVNSDEPANLHFWDTLFQLYKEPLKTEKSDRILKNGESILNNDNEQLFEIEKLPTDKQSKDDQLSQFNKNGQTILTKTNNKNHESFSTDSLMHSEPKDVPDKPKHENTPTIASELWPSEWSNLGQESENQWKNWGQESENQPSNLGQKSENQWSTWGQQSETQWSNLGQESENQWSNLGQESENQPSNMGRESENQGSNLGQHTQNVWHSHVHQLTGGEKQYLAQDKTRFAEDKAKPETEIPPFNENQSFSYFQQVDNLSHHSHTNNQKQPETKDTENVQGDNKDLISGHSELGGNHNVEPLSHDLDITSSKLPIADPDTTNPKTSTEVPRLPVLNTDTANIGRGDIGADDESRKFGSHILDEQEKPNLIDYSLPSTTMKPINNKHRKPYTNILPNPTVYKMPVIEESTPEKPKTVTIPSENFEEQDEDQQQFEQQNIDLQKTQEGLSVIPTNQDYKTVETEALEQVIQKHDLPVSKHYWFEEQETKHEIENLELSTKKHIDIETPLEATTEKTGFWSSVWNKTKRAKSSIVSWFKN